MCVFVCVCVVLASADSKTRLLPRIFLLKYLRSFNQSVRFESAACVCPLWSCRLRPSFLIMQSTPFLCSCEVVPVPLIGGGGVLSVRSCGLGLSDPAKWILVYRIIVLQSMLRFPDPARYFFFNLCPSFLTMRSWFFLVLALGPSSLTVEVSLSSSILQNGSLWPDLGCT